MFSVTNHLAKIVSVTNVSEKHGKVTTKKSRSAAPADKYADGAWPFPQSVQ